MNLPLTNPSEPLTLGRKGSDPEGERAQTKASVYTFSGFLHAVTAEGDVKQPLRRFFQPVCVPGVLGRRIMQPFKYES